MTDCLVTKLKGTVDNDSLEKFGEIKLMCAALDSYFGVVADEANTVLLKFTGGSVGGNTEMYAQDSGNMHIVPNVGVDLVKISANPKYDIITLGDVYPESGKLADLAYLKLKKFAAQSNRLNDAVKNIIGEFNISDLASWNYPELFEELAFSAGAASSLWKGDIQGFSSFVNLKRLELWNASTTKITGSISSLASLIRLELVNLASKAITGQISSLGPLTSLISLDLRASQVTGTLESFVAAQRSNGRTICESFTVNEGFGPNVTFNGSEIGDVASTSRTLTWTSDSITFNGVTINA